MIDASAGDTIDFAPSPSCSLITLTSGYIEITKNLTIDGPGAGALAVSGASLAAASVFVVDNVTATISGLTIKDGGVNGGHCLGGGIDNSGALTITNSTVSGSKSSCDGGGIYNGSGTVTLINSTVSDNTGDDGGGIYNGSGTVTVTNSTVSGNTGGGIFNASGTVTVTNSTVSGNTRAGTGGGMYNESGTATLTDSTLSGNSAADGEGGGISNGGTLTVTDSTLSGNTDSNEGGGGIANGGTATVTDSTLSDNSAPGGGGILNEGQPRFVLNVNDSTLSGNSGGTGEGGGILNDGGTANVTDSTISGNSDSDSAGGGGGITNAGTLTVTHATLWDNTADAGDGGGLYNQNNATLVATIVANSGTGLDCVGEGTYTSDYNLADDASCAFSGTSLSNTKAGLDSAGLQANGGPTQTIALEPGSAAIDHVASAADCTGKDQRGVLWPTPCDIGAIGTPSFSSIVLIPTNGATLSGTAATLDASASNATSVEFRLFGGSYGYNAPVLCTAKATYYGWVCSWNTTTVPNASYSLLSEAFGAGGSTFSSSVSITVANPPTTSVLIPSKGATLTGSTTLDASASNATSVKFLLFGGSFGFNAPVLCTATLTLFGWLCTWNTTTVPNGSYTLLSEAFNSVGSAFSPGVSITVHN